MADKRQIRKGIRRLQQVKTWQLIVLFVLAGIIAATFLRLNNIGMVERRDAVIAADKAGDAEDTQDRLYDLQRYSSQHMNAGSGRIALEHQYRRDSQRVKDSIAADNSGQGSKVQQAAIAVCDPIARANNWRWPDHRYISCIDDELSKRMSSNTEVSKVELPDAKLYHHEFVSPLWSPDFAGWSVLACAVILLVLIGRLITLAILKLLLQRRYRSV